MDVRPSFMAARVWHKRFFPRVHEFVYNVYYVVLPVSKPTLAQNAFFSIDAWNIWSIRIRDHGARDGSPWEPWIRTMLKDHGLAHVCTGPIELMTHPRLLGYAFNPISFWFCLDADSNLRAVLCEVRNTFGDRQQYLVAHDDGRPIGASDIIEGTKVMHVSPFNVVEGSYRFSFDHTEKKIRVNVDYYVDGERMIGTAVSGSRSALTQRVLAYAFFRYPLMTVKVIAGIHYEAAKLWIIKKMPYRRYMPHANTSVQRVRRSIDPPGRHTV